MTKREELDGMLALLRAMNGEEDVIEHMESEGQKQAVNNTMMARNMKPSREYWEQLGFAFEDIPDDYLLYNATMPEGWALKMTDNPMWSDICDEIGNVRGSMFYKASFYDRSAHMFLKCRYDVCTDCEYTDDSKTTEVYFGNPSEKLFIAGKAYLNKNMSREEKDAFYDEKDRLKNLAKKFAEENYPEWENVAAYWNPNKRSM